MAFLEEYTFLGKLGEGSFATVYKVRHNELGYIRAVRVLKDTIQDKSDKAYQNFLHECKILLVLGNGNHRGIVHIYKPDLLANKAFVEMDYVDGKDLLHYLADNKYFLPTDEVIRMLSEMSSALAYCHEDIYKFRMDRESDDLKEDPFDGSKLLIDDVTRSRLIEDLRVIHNDIHSRNIMRRENGDFVLLDFGLAIDGEEVFVGSSRRNVGALEYLSPEKWNGEKKPGTESDVYSFGVVMYEYLTGRVPFKMEGDSNSEQAKLYDKIRDHSIPSIFEMRKKSYEVKYPGQKYEKDYPDWLEVAILKCLEFKPSERFSNGKELHKFVIENIDKEKKYVEKTKFDSVVREMGAQISNLQTEKTNLLFEKENLGNENADLTLRIGVLEKEVADLQTENRDLKSWSEKLRKKIYSYMRKKNVAIVFCFLFLWVAGIFSYLYLKSPNDAYDTNELLVKQTELNNQLENLTTELDAKNNELQAKKKEIDDLKKRISDLNSGQPADVQKLQKQIDDLNSKVSEKQSDIDKLTKQVNDRQKEINELRKGQVNPKILDEKNAEIKRLNGLVDDKENSISKLNADISKLQQQLKNVGSSSADKEEIERLNKLVVAKQNEITQLNADKNSLTAKLKAKQDELKICRGW